MPELPETIALQMDKVVDEVLGPASEAFYDVFNPANFPAISGVYLIYNDEACLYVGQSQNIRHRWTQHHLVAQLTTYPSPLWMVWIEIVDGRRREIVTQLILALNPRLNRVRPAGEARRKLLIRLPEMMVDDLKIAVAHEKMSIQDFCEQVLGPAIDQALTKHGLERRQVSDAG
jgi:hypothetical protein